MHKLLITTLAALLLAAGAYAQESMDMAEDMTEDMDMEAMDEAMDDMDTGPSVTVSASGGIGVKFTEKQPLSTFALFDVTFAASGTTDGGLTFGGSITIDGSDGDTSHVNDASVSIGSDIWSISAGNLDPATAKARVLGDIGFDGIGVDDVAEAATATAADLALGVSLGGASMTLTYGSAATAAIPAMLVTPAVEGKAAVEARTGLYDIWVTNTHHDPDADEAATGLAAADAMLGYIGPADSELPLTTVDAAATASTEVPAHLVEAGGGQTPTLFTNMKDAEAHVVWLNCGMDTTPGAGIAMPEVTAAEGTTAHGEQTTALRNWEEQQKGCTIRAIQDPVAAADAVTAVEAVYSEMVPAGDDDEWAIALGFGAGGVEVAVGYDSNKLVNMGVKSSLGGVDAAAYIERPSGMESNLGINLGMTVTEGTTASIGFSKNGTTGGDAVGVGLSFDLGGGAAFKMGAGVVNDNTVADMGVSMSF